MRGWDSSGAAKASPLLPLRRSRPVEVRWISPVPGRTRRDFGPIMRVLVQRVSKAGGVVAGETVGAIGCGLLLLVGVTHDDDASVADLLASKVANLRIFDDANGDLNRSALDLVAEDPSQVGVLVVSQFTLYGDVRKGRRPSFVSA